MDPSGSNFNRIAVPYRWLEYLTFGKALENCRLHFLPQVLDRRRVLILGDGDGRFLAQLLKHNARLHADAVDSSDVMLKLLRQRCEATSLNIRSRLSTYRQDALTFEPKDSYDLVVTHFFLDCFNPAELNSLIARITPILAPGALWLISDFRIPTGPMRLPAKLLIRSLYLAFRILTGLRTVRMPDHAAPLTQAGLTQIAHQHRLAGLLTTELWKT